MLRERAAHRVRARVRRRTAGRHGARRTGRGRSPSARPDPRGYPDLGPSGRWELENRVGTAAGSVSRSVGPGQEKYFFPHRPTVYIVYRASDHARCRDPPGPAIQPRASHATPGAPRRSGPRRADPSRHPPLGARRVGGNSNFESAPWPGTSPGPTTAMTKNFFFDTVPPVYGVFDKTPHKAAAPAAAIMATGSTACALFFLRTFRQLFVGSENVVLKRVRASTFRNKRNTFR